MNQAQTDFGAPSDRVKGKIRDYMCEVTQDFIRSSPFVVIATSSGDGSCDASPKGGTPGFVKVLTDRQLLLPDVAGNKLFQSFENLETNNHIGMVFMIPGCDVTFRVNGKAKRVLKDDPVLNGVAVETLFSDDNTKLLQGTLIDIEETYIHCPRAFMFSGIWDTAVIADNQRSEATRNWGERWRATFA